MNIISIDTLSSTLSVAVFGPEGLVTQSFTGNRPSHAEQLLPLIDTAVSAAGFTPQETNLVLAAEGPGSFTGLRLGYSAAKALQLSTGALFTPIPTLPCLASLYDSWTEGVAALIDAKRNRFYTQLFTKTKPVTEAADSTIDEILDSLNPSYRWLIIGYGTETFRTAICAATHNKQLFFLETHPVSFAPAMIAYAQKHVLGRADTPDYAGPSYIRKSNAEKD